MRETRARSQNRTEKKIKIWDENVMICDRSKNSDFDGHVE